MQRVCFLLKVRSEMVAEYRERHRDVWADMLAALSRAGWRDFSLFLREDGLLVGYLETDDFGAARAAMDATEVNTRWRPRWRGSSKHWTDRHPMPPCVPSPRSSTWPEPEPRQRRTNASPGPARRAGAGQQGTH